ncbi:DNA-methyltransferase [Phascolarctobacterium sp.]|uniref:DNA-methyltransferase n=1 Tax=Phascolarctobacterium sp. TaxID=2049039 RepID=UPI003870E06A
MKEAELLQGDCLELMRQIPDKSVDMILCDLPYGTTKNSWDSVIDPVELWGGYNRIIKDNGAIVLFSAQPFTSQLVMSNLKYYRYEWIWRKTQAKGHLNAKRMPLRAHENIEVFYKKPPTYNPQMTHGHKRKFARNQYVRENTGASCYGSEKRNTVYDSTDRYPVDVQTFSNGDQTHRYHVTQKPVSLLEYLIRTYTNEGETVLDNCMGGGSTGVACIRTGRQFIGMELDKAAFEIAKERIETEAAQYAKDN